MYTYIIKYIYVYYGIQLYSLCLPSREREWPTLRFMSNELTRWMFPYLSSKVIVLKRIV